MSVYPVIRNPGSVERLLTRIRDVDLPARVDQDFLAEIGFRRDADVHLLGFLEFLGYTRDGKPTVLWEKSQDSDEAALLLGRSVKAAYSKLFASCPNALEADGTALMNFFRESTNASDHDAAYMILTFKVLSDIADFPEPTHAEPDEPAPEEPAPSDEHAEVPEEPIEPEQQLPPAETPEMTGEPCPVVRLSIHIDISDDSDPDIRDLVHRLLKMHLESSGN